ncbi:hypothetical protein HRbin31_00443 [bacterium HR31]|nr:hypothetical protein HRbin31_00443 [bacterium HR31]
MVDLVLLLQAPEDGDGVLHRRLPHVDRLEPALQGRVLLDVLPVLVQGSSADAVQLAAGQHGLEDVGGVHGRPLRGTRAHHGVDLVDEQDDLALAVRDLLQHRLQPLLELPPVLGPGHEGAHVQLEDPLVLELLRHVPAHDALREPLHDGGLAYSGLADEHGVVLRPAAQHVDHPPDLLVPPDHRVQLALTGQLGEVTAVTLQHLVLGLRPGVGDPHPPPDLRQGPQHHLLGDPVLLEHPTGAGLRRIRHGQEEVFGARVLVPHPLRFALRRVPHPPQPRRQVQLRGSVHLRQHRQRLVCLLPDARHRGAGPLQDLRHDAVGLLQQRRQQVFGVHLRVGPPASQLLRPQQGLL